MIVVRGLVRVEQGWVCCVGADGICLKVGGGLLDASIHEGKLGLEGIATGMDCLV